MNSALPALLFVIRSSGSSSEDDLGQLRHAYLALCGRPALLDISRLLTWVMFICSWAQPFRQRDVAEFIQHIARATLPSGMLNPILLCKPSIQIHASSSFNS